MSWNEVDRRLYNLKEKIEKLFLTATDPEEYQQLLSNGIVVNTFIKDSLIEDRLAMIDMREFISTIFDPDPGLTNIPPLSTLPNGILKICEMMEARHNIAVSDTVVAPLPSVFHKLVGADGLSSPQEV